MERLANRVAKPFQLQPTPAPRREGSEAPTPAFEKIGVCRRRSIANPAWLACSDGWSTRKVNELRSPGIHLKEVDDPGEHGGPVAESFDGTWVITTGAAGMRSQALGLAEAVGLPIVEK